MIVEVAALAGCTIVQDEHNRYRVLTTNLNHCLLDTPSLDVAYKVAEEFSKMYMGALHSSGSEP